MAVDVVLMAEVGIGVNVAKDWKLLVRRHVLSRRISQALFPERLKPMPTVRARSRRSSCAMLLE